MQTCPLTLTKSARLVEHVPTEIITKRYRSMFGIDVAYLFADIPSLGVYRCEESGLVFFDPPVCGDGAFYEALQQIDWYYQENKNEFDLARESIAPGTSVLEVGCGGGAFLSSLQGRSVRGIEYNDAAIAKARARGLSVEKRTMQDLIGEGEAFDVVCSFQVLEHVSEPRSFLEECRKLTRPGGLVIVGVPNLECFAAMPGMGEILNVPPHHVSWWAPSTFEWLGRQPGWKLVRCVEESLQDEQLLIWAETTLYNVIGGSRRRGRLVEIPSRRSPSRIAARLLAPMLARCVRDERLRPRGQALVAILENAS